MEDARFFHQQANWCYQLAWQCFDLVVAHKLNVMANQHNARASVAETEGAPGADAEARRDERR
jgi:hypothetical protein